MSQERIIDRVRKMLALAKDAGATEGERDNALRMAHATIAKYNLDMAAVEREAKKKGTSESAEPREFHSARFFGRPWARQVAVACAELFFCEYLYVPAFKGKDTTHIFVGRVSNTLTAAEMAQWLVAAVMKEGKRYQRANDAGNIAYRSFAVGAAGRIRDRVREIRLTAEAASDALAPATGRSDAVRAPTDAAAASGGTAIVLRSVYATEHAENKALIEKKYGGLTRKGRGGKDVEIGAALAGREYGDKVNLDRQVR